MSFEIVKGDLFDPAFRFDGIAQGVNTLGVMGAGIAVPFRETWPSMYNQYRRDCKRFGSALAGSLFTWHDSESDLVIFNLFSQIEPGRNGDYTLLRRAAVQLVLEAEARNHKRIGLPWIGCGIAGLAKHNVEEILHDVFDDSPVNFVLVEQ
jgi:O-acetyl-ADP-ribose deacetylase (regulator of RNase III)